MDDDDYPVLGPLDLSEGSLGVVIERYRMRGLSIERLRRSGVEREVWGMVERCWDRREAAGAEVTNPLPGTSLREPPLPETTALVAGDPQPEDPAATPHLPTRGFLPPPPRGRTRLRHRNLKQRFPFLAELICDHLGLAPLHILAAEFDRLMGAQGHGADAPAPDARAVMASLVLAADVEYRARRQAGGATRALYEYESLYKHIEKYVGRGRVAAGDRGAPGGAAGAEDVAGILLFARGADAGGETPPPNSGSSSDYEEANRSASQLDGAPGEGPSDPLEPSDGDGDGDSNEEAEGVAIVRSKAVNLRRSRVLPAMFYRADRERDAAPARAGAALARSAEPRRGLAVKKTRVVIRDDDEGFIDDLPLEVFTTPDPPLGLSGYEAPVDHSRFEGDFARSPLSFGFEGAMSGLEGDSDVVSWKLEGDSDDALLSEWAAPHDTRTLFAAEAALAGPVSAEWETLEDNRVDSMLASGRNSGGGARSGPAKTQNGVGPAIARASGTNVGSYATPTESRGHRALVYKQQLLDAFIGAYSKRRRRATRGTHRPAARRSHTHSASSRGRASAVTPKGSHPPQRPLSGPWEVLKEKSPQRFLEHPMGMPLERPRKKPLLEGASRSSHTLHALTNNPLRPPGSRRQVASNGGGGNLGPSPGAPLAPRPRSLLTGNRARRPAAPAAAPPYLAPPSGVTLPRAPYTFAAQLESEMREVFPSQEPPPEDGERAAVLNLLPPVPPAVAMRFTVALRSGRYRDATQMAVSMPALLFLANLPTASGASDISVGQKPQNPGTLSGPDPSAANRFELIAALVRYKTTGNRRALVEVVDPYRQGQREVSYELVRAVKEVVGWGTRGPADERGEDFEGLRHSDAAFTAYLELLHALLLSAPRRALAKYHDVFLPEPLEALSATELANQFQAIATFKRATDSDVAAKMAALVRANGVYTDVLASVVDSLTEEGASSVDASLEVLLAFAVVLRTRLERDRAREGRERENTRGIREQLSGEFRRYERDGAASLTFSPHPSTTRAYRALFTALRGSGAPSERVLAVVLDSGFLEAWARSGVCTASCPMGACKATGHRASDVRSDRLEGVARKGTGLVAIDAIEAGAGGAFSALVEKLAPVVSDPSLLVRLALALLAALIPTGCATLLHLWTAALSAQEDPQDSIRRAPSRDPWGEPLFLTWPRLTGPSAHPGQAPSPLSPLRLAFYSQFLALYRGADATYISHAADMLIGASRAGPLVGVAGPVAAPRVASPVVAGSRVVSPATAAPAPGLVLSTIMALTAQAPTAQLELLAALPALFTSACLLAVASLKNAAARLRGETLGLVCKFIADIAAWRAATFGEREWRAVMEVFVAAQASPPRQPSPPVPSVALPSPVVGALFKLKTIAYLSLQTYPDFFHFQALVSESQPPTGAAGEAGDPETDRWEHKWREVSGVLGP